MKKKRIKELNGNEVIHAPTERIAEALCKKFDRVDKNSSHIERKINTNK